MAAAMQRRLAGFQGRARPPQAEVAHGCTGLPHPMLIAGARWRGWRRMLAWSQSSLFCRWLEKVKRIRGRKNLLEPSHGVSEISAKCIDPSLRTALLCATQDDTLAGGTALVAP